MKTPESLVPPQYSQDPEGNLYKEIDHEIWYPLDQVLGRFTIPSVSLLETRRQRQQLIAGTTDLNLSKYHRRTRRK